MLPLFQEDAIFEFLTVREHLELFEALLGQGLGPGLGLGQGSAQGLGQGLGLGQGYSSSPPHTPSTTPTPISGVSTVDLTLARLGREREDNPPVAYSLYTPYRILSYCIYLKYTCDPGVYPIDPYIYNLSLSPSLLLVLACMTRPD